MRTILYFAGFLVFGLVLFVVVGEMFDKLDWLDSLGSWAWLAAVGLMIADIAIPIPATGVITLMGAKYGWFLGGVIGTLGSFSAGVIAYGLTRMLGRRFAVWLLREDLQSAEKFFNNDGAFAVACSRWLPLVPEAVSCLAGLTRMPFRQYCLALLCGAVPMCFSYAMLPTMFDDKITPLLISIILPVPIWWIAGRMLHRRARGNANDVSPPFKQ